MKLLALNTEINMEALGTELICAPRSTMANVAFAFALVCLCHVFGGSDAARFAPILNTRNLGQLVGVREFTEDNTPYYSFKGLRYAAPPVGPLRFKEPREGWPVAGNAIVNATVFGPACLQIYRHPSTLRGNEDCLLLNVYTPSASQAQSQLYPVVVFLHGGSFVLGSATENPRRLMSRGIVVVTVQYRLGVLGFLSSGDKDLPGNLGLLDQQLALKWVQQNIHEFCGDRNRVTLAGSSSGGASVTLHMVAPGSRGLFQRVIAGSSVFLNPWVIHTGDPETVRTVARAVGCPCVANTPIAVLLACLRSADPNRLAQAQSLFQDWNETPAAPFGPVIDRNFVSEDPYKFLREGNFARVPLLLSYTTAQGNFVVSEFMENRTALVELDRKWLQKAPALLDYEDSAWTQRDRDFISSAARNLYLGRAPIDNNTVPQLIQLVGDRRYISGIDRFAKTLASAKGSQPIYMYQYAYRGEFSASQTWSNSTQNLGPTHIDDIGLMFTGLFDLPAARSEVDLSMARSLVDVWESFIKTGVPTTANFPVWKPVPTTGDRLTFLNITSFNAGNLATVDEIGHSSFWRNLPLMESGLTD